MKDIYLITASFVGEITRDFEGYLRMTKKAGYKGIEMFRCPYDKYTGAELRKIIEDHGLTAISCHVDAPESDKMIEYLPDTGVQFMVNPGLRVADRDEAYRGAELLNEIGKKCKAAGLRYGYHNLNNDFDQYDGKSVIDIFMENTDPEYVTFEIDAAWAWRAGVNAAEFIRDHAGRVDLVHVKETSRVLGPEDDLSRFFKGLKRDEKGFPIFTEEAKKAFEEHQKINCKLGDGIINMPEIIKAADAQGVKAYIVEREYAWTGDPYTTILDDYEYLSKL